MDFSDCCDDWIKQNKDEYGETMIQAFTKFTKALHEHERFCKAWEKMKSKPISWNTIIKS